MHATNVEARACYRALSFVEIRETTETAQVGTVVKRIKVVCMRRAIRL